MRILQQFGYEYKSVRKGLNGLGILLMAAGVVGYFINPSVEMQEVKLIFIGLGLILFSGLYLEDESVEVKDERF